MTKPVLSIIVIIASDTTVTNGSCRHLEGCLAALQAQALAPPLEVIVPYQPAVHGLAELQLRYPEVIFLPFERLAAGNGSGHSREHHDELRARALPMAHGDLIALAEDHDRPAPTWAANIVGAHAGRFAAHAGVGGAVENGIDSPLNWAVYFCDFGRYQNPLPSEDAVTLTDVNASYKRAALDAIQPVWREFFHETIVNDALRARGERLGLSPEIVVYQHRKGLRLSAALVERYIWGRSYGATRCRLVSGRGRVVLTLAAPWLPVLLLWRMLIVVLRKRRALKAFARALPLTALCVAAWSWGEWLGYLTGHPHGAAAVAGEALAMAVKRGSS